MGKTAKNLAFILGLATIAFGGYFFYTQFNTASTPVPSDQELQTMLSDTRVFIERGEILNAMSFDLDIIENESLDSLTSFDREPQTQSVGRSDPFSQANSSVNQTTEDETLNQ